MGAADAVKDDVYTLTREAVNFFHELLVQRLGVIAHNIKATTIRGAPRVRRC
jgi:hypothetical protein